MILIQAEVEKTMHVVAEGSVRVSRDGAVVDYLGEHEVLGEMAVRTVDVQSASAHAATRTRRLEIDQDGISNLAVLPGLLDIIIGRRTGFPPSTGPPVRRIREGGCSTRCPTRCHDLLG